MESIICKLVTGEISIFELVSVAEETGLKLALSETPITGFVARRPIRCLSCMSSLWPGYLYQKQSDQGLHCLPLNPYIFRDSIWQRPSDRVYNFPDIRDR